MEMHLHGHLLAHECKDKRGGVQKRNPRKDDCGDDEIGTDLVLQARLGSSRAVVRQDRKDKESRRKANQRVVHLCLVRRNLSFGSPTFYKCNVQFASILPKTHTSTPIRKHSCMQVDPHSKLFKTLVSGSKFRRMTLNNWTLPLICSSFSTTLNSVKPTRRPTKTPTIIS